MEELFQGCKQSVRPLVSYLHESVKHFMVSCDKK